MTLQHYRNMLIELLVCDCPQCGRVIHDPTDGEDQAHCYCTRDTFSPYETCRCMCHAA
jgi:hypothetical protein